MAKSQFKKITPKQVKFAVNKNNAHGDDIPITVINSDLSSYNSYINACDDSENDNPTMFYIAVLGITLDINLSNKVIVLLQKSTSLKINRGHNLGGGVFTSFKDEGHAKSQGDLSSYDVNRFSFNSYINTQGCNIVELINAFDNGETLYCEIELS